MAVFSNTLGKVDTSNPEEAIKKMANHIRQLQEELEYKLANLDGANFNETGLKEITDPVYAQIGDVEGKVTQLSLDMDGLTLVVQNGSESSVVSLKSGNIVLSSGVIQLSGLVSFSDLSGNGTTEINGANIKTGYISADRISGGTLQGVYITSESPYDGTVVDILNGGVGVQDGSGVGANFKYNASEGKVYLSANCPLKIDSSTNISIHSDSGSIYLEGAHVYVNGKEIGV